MSMEPQRRQELRWYPPQEHFIEYEPKDREWLQAWGLGTWKQVHVLYDINLGLLRGKLELDLDNLLQRDGEFLLNTRNLPW